MCFSNAEEIEYTLTQWYEVYPKGAPDAFMPSAPSISQSLLLGKKGRENITKRLDAMRSVPPVEQADSFPTAQS